ncbi:MAG: hypothetical protein HYV33_06135 [Candidatus Kerfeldbacteria bacterium]|nr:hypothetical protein [Candidatus Kerfeldbacteria bacterium]
MSLLTARISKFAYLGVGSASLLLAKTAFALSAEELGANYGANIGLGDASPEDIAVATINWVLGILALIAVVMILVGGFKWMTAGGNEEKVEGAKKLLIAALIGLVVILAAWGLSIYAINNLLNFTNAE